MTMTYQEQLKEYMNNPCVKGTAKDALAHLDWMDCVKALHTAKHFVRMLKLKCDETQTEIQLRTKQQER